MYVAQEYKGKKIMEVLKEISQTSSRAYDSKGKQNRYYQRPPTFQWGLCRTTHGALLETLIRNYKPQVTCAECLLSHLSNAQQNHGHNLYSTFCALLSALVLLSTTLTAVLFKISLKYSYYSDRRGNYQTLSLNHL